MTAQRLYLSRNYTMIAITLLFETTSSYFYFTELTLMFTQYDGKNNKHDLVVLMQ